MPVPHEGILKWSIVGTADGQEIVNVFWARVRHGAPPPDPPSPDMAEILLSFRNGIARPLIFPMLSGDYAITQYRLERVSAIVALPGGGFGPTLTDQIVLGPVGVFDGGTVAGEPLPNAVALSLRMGGNLPVSGLYVKGGKRFSPIVEAATLPSPQFNKVAGGYITLLNALGDELKTPRTFPAGAGSYTVVMGILSLTAAAVVPSDRFAPCTVATPNPFVGSQTSRKRPPGGGA